MFEWRFKKINLLPKLWQGDSDATTLIRPSGHHLQLHKNNWWVDFRENQSRPSQAAGLWISVPGGPLATAAIMCSNSLSIDGRGSAESLGVLNLSPVETILGPIILPAGMYAQPLSWCWHLLLGPLLKMGRAMSSDWRSSSAFSFEAPHFFVYVNSSFQKWDT